MGKQRDAAGELMSGEKAKVERYRAPRRTEPEKKVGKGAKAIGPHAWRATFKHERNMVAWVLDRLELLEPGLDLYEDVRTGKEYPCKMPHLRGRIDILAQDRRGGLVVIECKLGTAGAAALGQLWDTWGGCRSTFARRARRSVACWWSGGLRRCSCARCARCPCRSRSTSALCAGSWRGWPEVSRSEIVGLRVLGLIQEDVVGARQRHHHSDPETEVLRLAAELRTFGRKLRHRRGHVIAHQ